MRPKIITKTKKKTKKFNWILSSIKSNNAIYSTLTLTGFPHLAIVFWIWASAIAYFHTILLLYLLAHTSHNLVKCMGEMCSCHMTAVGIKMKMNRQYICCCCCFLFFVYCTQNQLEQLTYFQSKRLFSLDIVIQQNVPFHAKTLAHTQMIR